MPVTVLDLPPEMIAEITSHLPATTIASMRLTSRALNALTFPAPPLGRRAWIDFHHDFEDRARRTKTPIPLACTKCMKLLPPSDFQDSQAKGVCKRLAGRRCFQCGLMDGLYNVRVFLYQKQICFSCFACMEPKRAEEEAEYEVRWSGLPGHGGVKMAEQRNKRWCKKCWKVVTMYVNAWLV